MRPTILVIQLNKDVTHDVMSSHPIKFLRKRLMIVEATTAADALSKITSLIPTTIIITTPQFINHRHTVLHSKVVEYCRAGGTVLFCGRFCTALKPADFETFMSSKWDLSWKFGVTVRTIYRMNPEPHAKLQDKRYPVYYGPKARHVTGVSPQDMVFVTHERCVMDISELDPDSLQYKLAKIEEQLERVQRSIRPLGWIPPPPTIRSAHRPDESPVIFTSFGDGYLGYVGDVNLEEETNEVLACMCSYQISEGVEDMLGDKTRCRLCLKAASKKCATCKDVSYCSRECQKMDWKEHKETCIASY
jgi:MYND finger